MKFMAFMWTALISTQVFAISKTIQTSSCQLQDDEVITIGCTYHCSRWVRWAIYRRARQMGYKVRIKNIFAKNTSPDISKLDGILIPGGADINPKYYTPHVEPDLAQKIEDLDYLVNYDYEGRERDPFEYELLQTYFGSENFSTTPILGICRGMQMLAVSQKIPLIVDIKEELGFRNRYWAIDRIRAINPESVIEEQIRTNFWGVQYHHQAIRYDYFNKNRGRWPHLEITALSNGDKIPEALEFYDRPVLGVQFHPEWTFGSVRYGTFGWLLNRACNKKRVELDKARISKND